MNAHSQNLINDATAIHPFIREVSKLWRVPAELVSAVLALAFKETQLGQAVQSVNDKIKHLPIASNSAPIIGNGILEDGSNMFACWYFAIRRAAMGTDGFYGSGSCGPGSILLFLAGL